MNYWWLVLVIALGSILLFIVVVGICAVFKLSGEISEEEEKARAKAEKEKREIAKAKEKESKDDNRQR